MTDASLRAAKSKRARWFFQFKFWEIFSWVCVSVIALGSVLVASSVSEEWRIREYVALLVAASSMLLLMWRPVSRARGMRRAYIKIDHDIRMAEGGGGDIERAIVEAEEILQSTYFPLDSAEP